MIILNFANPDMVSHTGSFEAAVKAVQAVDTLFRVVSVRLYATRKVICWLPQTMVMQSLWLTMKQVRYIQAIQTNLVPLILMSDSLKTATLEVW